MKLQSFINSWKKPEIHEDKVPSLWCHGFSLHHTPFPHKLQLYFLSSSMVKETVNAVLDSSKQYDIKVFSLELAISHVIHK